MCVCVCVYESHLENKVNFAKGFGNKKHCLQLHLFNLPPFWMISRQIFCEIKMIFAVN